MDSEARRQEHFSSLILLQLPDLGPSRYGKLRERFGSSTAILATSTETLRPFLSAPAYEQLRVYHARPSDHPLAQQALRDLDRLEREQIHLLALGDPLYPALLKNIPAAPPLLYVRGELANLALPQIAMVGSRNPSPGGRSNAYDFARQLAAMGFTITSGLALGIDGAAHAGALAADGRTIAVMGTGIDTIYPRRHSSLAQKILAEGGTLLSEFPLGAAPHASHFPRRNRIISGLSMAVLVVEAAVKSGSLITARYALQHGREVFAVPGSIHNPLSRGCHLLLREGAILVEQIADMKDALQGMLAFKWQEAGSSDSLTAESESLHADVGPEESLVLDALGYDVVAFDELSERTHLPAGRLLSILTRLELNGLLQQSPDGYERCVASTEKS